MINYTDVEKLRPKFEESAKQLGFDLTRSLLTPQIYDALDTQMAFVGYILRDHQLCREHQDTTLLKEKV